MPFKTIEQIREYDRIRNKLPHRRAKGKLYYLKHKEERNQYSRDYYQKHKEHLKNISKIWYNENRGKIRSYFRAWKKGKKAEWLALTNEQYADLTKKCAVCGFRDVVVVHHIDGNHTNNEKENLLGLCPNHHLSIHRKHKTLNELFVEYPIKPLFQKLQTIKELRDYANGKIQA